MPSDDPEISATQASQVRRVIREETDAALRHQRKMFVAALAVFCGGQLLLVGVALVGFPLYAVTLGGFVAFFGLVVLLGQHSFTERRSGQATTLSSRE